MAVSYQFAGSLAFSPDTGAPVLTIQASGSGSFTSRQDGILSFTGTGTAPIPFGTIPAEGVKAVLIEVDPDTNPSTRFPIIVKFNGALTGVEVAPGGSMLIHNPKPDTGVTQIDIDYTSDNVVRYWLLG